MPRRTLLRRGSHYRPQFATSHARTVIRTLIACALNSADSAVTAAGPRTCGRCRSETLTPVSELFNTGRTYGVTVNGRIHTELGERRGSPPVPNELAGFLDRLDGETRFSVSLWELPAGTSFDRVDLERWPVAYLQAAGNRDRMMIELRRDMESHHQHYVIGKCDTTEPDLREEIRWDAYFDRVNEVEVFTAAEAVPLFLSYWQTNELPGGYCLRAVDL